MDRPILFSGPMVRALLDGRKTQTRRVMKPQPYPLDGYGGFWNASGCVGGRIVIADAELARLHGYAVGYRLWVRESITLLPRTAYALPKATSPDEPDMAAYYRADFDRSGKQRWRPSNHMPRWASRITLLVTDVRVQRLHAISEADAIAEGVPLLREAEPARGWLDHASGDLERGLPSARDSYRTLWDSLNADRAPWSSNPWIVAITFAIERRNIDEVARNG